MTFRVPRTSLGAPCSDRKRHQLVSSPQDDSEIAAPFLGVQGNPRSQTIPVNSHVCADSGHQVVPNSTEDQCGRCPGQASAPSSLMASKEGHVALTRFILNTAFFQCHFTLVFLDYYKYTNILHIYTHEHMYIYVCMCYFTSPHPNLHSPEATYNFKVFFKNVLVFISVF